MGASTIVPRLQPPPRPGDHEGVREASLPRYDFGTKRDAAVAAARTMVEHVMAAGVAGPAPGSRVEMPFMVRLDRVLVRGIIDRTDLTADGTTINDYNCGGALRGRVVQVDRKLVRRPLSPLSC